VRLSQEPESTLPPNTKVVIRSTRFGNPFTVTGPIRGAGPSWRVVWFYFGAGCGRQAPAGFEPIKCETSHEALEHAVRLFREWVTAPEQSDLLVQVRHQLVGFNLACWCPLDLPCHADVLLELANAR
jgi:hypothetical protein